MSNDNTIELHISGVQIEGWKSFSVEFNMENLVSTFTFELYDKDGTITSQLESGLEVQVYLIQNPRGTKTKIIDGFIVGINRSLGSDGTKMTISGADKLVDLVDCSAVHKSQTWTNSKFSQIIKDIAAPFGRLVSTIELAADPVVGLFTIQSGETSFAAIERLCRMQAVIPLGTFDANLKLDYAAPKLKRTRVDLEVGKNIKQLSESTSWNDKFSLYLGRAQTSGKGKKWTKEIIQVNGNAEDAGVNRYRPMLFVAEGKMNKAEMQSRINWEAQVRSGRATTHTVIVDGWFQKRGGVELALWEKNWRIQLKHREWNLDDERIITKVRFSLNTSGGEQTTLTLRHPDIFKANPSELVDLDLVRIKRNKLLAKQKAARAAIKAAQELAAKNAANES